MTIRLSMPTANGCCYGGHFYGGHIAFVMDSLKNSVANIADLLDRQMALLVDARYSNGLPANLSGATGPRAAINHGLKALQISVSAWTAEALKLTMPASVFSRSTECHNQDKVSMGTIAARDGLRVLELTEQVAAALLITVRQGVWLRCRIEVRVQAATAAGVDAGRPGRRYRGHRRRPQARTGSAFIVGAHCRPRLEDSMSEAPGRWVAEIETQVQFFDLDPMEVVWHGHYVKYLEIARCALLDRIGYNYQQMKASGYAWPVIDMHIRYASPATFGQRLKLRAEIVEWENRLKIQYLITDAMTGRRLSRASTTQVAVDGTSGEMCFVSPPVLFEKLGVSPP